MFTFNRLLRSLRPQREVVSAFGQFYNPNSQKFFAKNSTRLYATYRRFNNEVTSSNPLQDIHLRKVIIGITGVGSIIYFTHLEEAPVTGRRRFIWTSEKMERWIGDRSYRELLNEYRRNILPENHPQTVRARRVFKKILEASPVDEATLDWKVHVINDPQAPPNAFVLPGGKVFVFSSILPVCSNDDGLATVLSHEFAHQLARHTGENISAAPIYGLISIALYTITGADFFNNLIMNTVFKMPASREMETEADYIGLMLMSKACYDPREAPKLWNRMSNWEKSTVVTRMPEMLSTHPASERRIQNMNKWLPEAFDAREASHCGQYSDFLGLRGEIW
jgi:predicted Zn-dependent protease